MVLNIKVLSTKISQAVTVYGFFKTEMNSVVSMLRQELNQLKTQKATLYPESYNLSGFQTNVLLRAL